MSTIPLKPVSNQTVFSKAFNVIKSPTALFSLGKQVKKINNQNVSIQREKMEQVPPQIFMEKNQKKNPKTTTTTKNPQHIESKEMTFSKKKNKSLTRWQ